MEIVNVQLELQVLIVANVRRASGAKRMAAPVNLPYESWDVFNLDVVNNLTISCIVNKGHFGVNSVS